MSVKERLVKRWLEEVQFHEAVEMMRRAGAQIKEALDEIDRLERERDRLRDILRAAARGKCPHGVGVPVGMIWADECEDCARDALRSPEDKRL